MIVIKEYTEKYGQTIGGLLGIACAAFMYCNYKLAGGVLAITAVTLVVISQLLRNKKEEKI
jgi:hypothetical protein